ncbi:hypothetical protein L486_06133 [Kwoniella mangroviensis CBS 10435]|uniref:Uncharacterized protein n=1 Tax=Kwoniella mangroviensis CBS 10435 TaxID=1331196 RepID=A0A1B9IKX2_9TREE|nr:hypothetical protein L486_06133 [Kwoniella mangroviensis CBS 10435]
MSRPTTPSTPVRPPRSERRLTLESIASLPTQVPSDRSTPPPPLPSSSPVSSEESEPQTPKTATTPTTGLPSSKSFDSSLIAITRLSREEQPPRYILPVDVPVPLPVFAQDQPEAGPSSSSASQTSQIDFSASRPPSYANENHQAPRPIITASIPTSENHQTSHDELYFDPTAGLGGHQSPTFTLQSSDELPCYAEETQTEPKTLARALWKWGWICPLLWIIGMCIMWIPLKPIEEESDPEKAQKLEEMIVILRKAEMKYAKRCAYGTLGFSVLLMTIIVIAIVLSKVLE